MTYDEAIRIAIDCLRAHSIGPAGVFSKAADVLQHEIDEMNNAGWEIK